MLSSTVASVSFAHLLPVWSTRLCLRVAAIPRPKPKLVAEASNIIDGQVRGMTNLALAKPVLSMTNHSMRSFVNVAQPVNAPESSTTTTTGASSTSSSPRARRSSSSAKKKSKSRPSTTGKTTKKKSTPSRTATGSGSRARRAAALRARRVTRSAELRAARVAREESRKQRAAEAREARRERRLERLAREKAKRAERRARTIAKNKERRERQAEKRQEKREASRARARALRARARLSDLAARRHARAVELVRSHPRRALLEADPTRPRPPTTPYAKFVKERWQTVRDELAEKQNANATVGAVAKPPTNPEVFRAIAAEWNRLDANEKEKRQREYQPQRDAYESAMREFQDRSPPKRPLTGWMTFFVENQARVARDNPTLSMTEVVRLIAADWKSLAPSEKESRNAKATADLAAWHKRMEDWRKANPNQPVITIRKLVPPKSAFLKEAIQSSQNQKQNQGEVEGQGSDGQLAEKKKSKKQSSSKSKANSSKKGTKEPNRE